MVIPFVLLATEDYSVDSALIASSKVNRIVEGLLESNETLTFSEDEINSLLIDELPPQISTGISNVKIQILPGHVVMDADVELQKFKITSSPQNDFFISLLLSGKRRINLDCTFTSSKGVGILEVTSIKIDGTVLKGQVLHWFIDEFLDGHVASLRLGEPAELPYNLDYIRLEDNRVVVSSF